MRAYRPLPPDADGLLPCAPLGLRIGVRDEDCLGIPGPWLRWIGDDGTPLPTSREWAARADEEKRRADALAARILELEEKG